METLNIKVDKIEEPRQPWRRTLSKARLEEMLGDVPNWDVREGAEFDAQLTRVGERDVLLEGAVTLKLSSDCRRCLRAVSSDVPMKFTLNFVARPTARSGRHAKDDDSGEGEFSASFDEGVSDEEFFDGETIDLAPVLREQLQLGLPPIEPLCREDCRGLCATCGQDLNERDCGHTQKVPDPRWSGLKDIKV